jgi:hypothetical protein
MLCHPTLAEERVGQVGNAVRRNEASGYRERGHGFEHKLGYAIHPHLKDGYLSEIGPLVDDVGLVWCCWNLRNYTCIEKTAAKLGLTTTKKGMTDIMTMSMMRTCGECV